MFNTDRLSHAYITDDSFADRLAMAVVCSARDVNRPCLICADCDKASRRIHPDIIEVKRLDNKLIISVDQIRELKQDVYIVPNEAMQKAYVVRDAEAMNTNAQNAFLQILEEPPGHAVFILCTESPAALLPTVRSRCVELKALPADGFADGGSGYAEGSADGGSDDASDGDAENDELEGLAGDFVDALVGDNVRLIECMFRIDKLDRFSMSQFLVLARGYVAAALRDGLSSGSSDSGALLVAESVLLKAEEMHALNVSAGHIAGYVCASVVSV